MSQESAAAHDESQTSPGLLLCGHRSEPVALPFQSRSILVGRHAGCLVRLNHGDVSMRHAMAIRFSHGIFLLDLDSRTGIGWEGESRTGGWLNGQDPARIERFQIWADGCPDGVRDRVDPMAGFIGDVERTPRVELEFVEGPLAGTRYRLKRSITLIGRGPRCKVRLRDDPDISRIHACLLLDEQGLYLIDTLSRCGTLVDGQEVRDTFLEEGQEFRIGNHLLVVSRCRIEDPGVRQRNTLTDAARDDDLPERSLVQSLHELRNIPDSERTERVDALLSAGRISSWQSRKIRRKDPLRLILDDRFLMMEPVARGGMSTVYRAIDLETGETVALKVPEIRVGDAERRFARFRREISISSRLTHPHIVPVRETGRSLRFLVFDFVPGRPLSRLIAQHGALDPAFVAEWFSEVADALAYAHEQGVIHRDIKPDNIMINETNSAMLLDLGLACLSEGEADGDGSAGLTRIGFTVGTLEFMSPEQAAGTGEIDCRADIYSLGCTMYAALSGRPPFQSPNPAELARQHLDAPPPAIPDLDPDLARIVERALEKRPADRFQTPGEFRAALQQWLEAEVACT